MKMVSEFFAKDSESSEICALDIKVIRNLLPERHQRLAPAE
jgi:hypothetical protein